MKLRGYWFDFHFDEILEQTVVIYRVNEVTKLLRSTAEAVTLYIKQFSCLYLIWNTHSNTLFSHERRNFATILLLHSAFWMKVPAACLMEPGILNYLIQRLLYISTKSPEGYIRFP